MGGGRSFAREEIRGEFFLDFCFLFSWYISGMDSNLQAVAGQAQDGGRENEGVGIGYYLRRRLLRSPIQCIRRSPTWSLLRYRPLFDDALFQCLLSSFPAFSPQGISAMEKIG